MSLQDHQKREPSIAKRALRIALLAGTALFIYGIWREYRSAGNAPSDLLFAMSIIIFMAGILNAFSKKERERVRKGLLDIYPSGQKRPQTDAEGKRDGYGMILIGIALFAIWSYFFGAAFLATA